MMDTCTTDGVVLDPDCSDFGPPHALPDEVELTPPGAELGLMLAAAADRSVLSGPDLLLLTRARARQIAHLQAQLMADLVAIAARCQPRISEPPPGSGRRAEPIDHAVDEIAADLTWTHTAASKQLDFAERLVECLPEVHAAMLAGQLDWPKARVLADGVTGLDPETARTITARLLPDAAERTTGQLRARLAKLIILADPDAARRRYRQGLKGRRVEHGREDDGTARLTGRWLPAARAAAANSRIQAIAAAMLNDARSKTAATHARSTRSAPTSCSTCSKACPCPAPTARPAPPARRPRPPRHRRPPRRRNQRRQHRRRRQTTTTAIRVQPGTKAQARATGAEGTSRTRTGSGSGIGPVRRMPTRTSPT